MITVPTLTTLGVKKIFTGFKFVTPVMTRIRAVTLTCGFAGRFAALETAGATPNPTHTHVAPKIASGQSGRWGRSISWFIWALWLCETRPDFSIGRAARGTSP